MEQDQLFERLWSSAAPMEEWTQAVSNGAITTVAANIITVHSTYFCGSVTAIRTLAGLVLDRHGQCRARGPDLCRGPPLGRQRCAYRDLYARPH
jgi:hypothetical protein